MTERDPFEVRFAFFWYNDEEIFHDSQEDIDRKIASVASQGITHVITFSCTHFRWSFRPWWQQINDCLRRIVLAAHRYDMKVIEHHSAELVSFPDTPQAMEFLKKYIGRRHSRMESWPGLVEMLLGKESPARIDAQIDLLTGDLLRTPYASTSKCYNSEHYRQEYLQYLESVYATGVDGIMTDDVQFWGDCACGHCQRRFKQDSGYDLPPLEKRADWLGNMREPSYIAWLKFRFASTRRFHELVLAHYRKLGLKMLRPNYISQGLCRDWTGNGVENAPALDWIFQEVALGCALRYTWPKVLAEQCHREMVARRRGIPHGMLFYAFNHDELLFSWGIAMLAGAFYINTPEGSSQPVDETPVRLFEQKYARELRHAAKMAQVGILDSQANRYWGGAYEVTHVFFYLELCCMHNIPCCLVGADAPESWERLPVLIVADVHILLKRQVERLLAYAEAGGNLLLSGIPGDQEEDGTPRSRMQCEQLWGISLKLPEGMKTRVTRIGRGSICLLSPDFAYPAAPEEIARTFGRDHMDFRPQKLPYDDLKFFPFVTPDWLQSHPGKMERLAQDARKGAEELNAFLASLLPHRNFITQLPDGVLAMPFKTENSAGWTIRLLNAAGTMQASVAVAQRPFGFPIPWKPWGNAPDGKITLRADGLERVRSVVFRDLSIEGVPLKWTWDGRQLHVVLPAGLLKDFGVVFIQA